MSVEMPRRHVVPEGDRLGEIEAARDASQRLRVGREFVEGRHQPVGVHFDRDPGNQHADPVAGLDHRCSGSLLIAIHALHPPGIDHDILARG